MATDYIQYCATMWAYLCQLFQLVWQIGQVSMAWLCSEILTDEWFKAGKGEWFIGLFGGVIAGIIGGYLTILILSRRVPKLEISKSMVLEHSLVKGKESIVKIKVVNKRRKTWWASGNAIDLKAELHLLENNGTSHRVELVSDEPLVLEHKCRANLLQNEVVFHVKRDHKTKVTSDFKEEKYHCIRFRIFARDSLSNYGHVYSELYRKGQIGYNPLVVGKFPEPGDVRIQEAPPTAPVAAV